MSRFDIALGKELPKVKKTKNSKKSKKAKKKVISPYDLKSNVTVFTNARKMYEFMGLAIGSWHPVISDPPVIGYHNPAWEGISVTISVEDYNKTKSPIKGIKMPVMSPVEIVGNLFRK